MTLFKIVSPPMSLATWAHLSLIALNAQCGL
jgi:hypothetical protein